MITAGRLVLLLLVTAMGGTQPGAAQSNADLILPEGTRIVLQLNDYLSTKLSTEGDRFTATVTVPVYQNEHLLIPKGSTISGSVSRIVRPGRFKGKAVMNLLFQSVRIPGKGQFPLVASLASVDSEGSAGVRAEGTIEGDGSTGRDAGRVAKPGLTGAGIGALAGGARGAGIGAGVGAAVGLATVFATRGKDIEVRRGSTMEISLDRPLNLAEPETTNASRPIR
jgi:hypothetical protein